MQKELLKTKPTCQICDNDRRYELHRALFVRPLAANLIRQTFSSWQEDVWICTQDLQDYRNKYVKHLLLEEKGEITTLD